jgi:hypothetical protein
MNLSHPNPEIAAPPRRPPSGFRAALAAPPADAASARYAKLAQAYRCRGGLATSDEVLRLLRPHAEQPISLLARWIVSRQAISFAWQSCTLLPMFQFARSDMALRDPVQAVSAELCGSYDEWDLAAWFVEPNSWLGGEAPADAIAHDLAAVLQAARADRYIAKG